MLSGALRTVYEAPRCLHFRLAHRFLQLSVSGTPAAIAWQVRASNSRLLQLEVPVTDKLFPALALGARRWRVLVAPAVGGASDPVRRLL